jgi:hypothetical protein
MGNQGGKQGRGDYLKGVFRQEEREGAQGRGSGNAGITVEGKLA